MYGQGTQAFYAPLGTPSGAGAAYLLMQHKRQLGVKTIARFTVFGKAQAQWGKAGLDVVFEVLGKVREEGGRNSICKRNDVAGCGQSLLACE